MSVKRSWRPIFNFYTHKKTWELAIGIDLPGIERHPGWTIIHPFACYIVIGPYTFEVGWHKVQAINPN